MAEKDVQVKVGGTLRHFPLSMKNNSIMSHLLSQLTKAMEGKVENIYVKINEEFMRKSFGKVSERDEM